MSEDIERNDAMGAGHRCPNCDTLAAPGAHVCLMCGMQLPEQGEPPDRTSHLEEDPRTEAQDAVPVDAGAEPAETDAEVAERSELGNADLAAAGPGLETGAQVGPESHVEAASASRKLSENSGSTTYAPVSQAPFIESVLLERQSAVASWLTVIILFFTLILGFLFWQNAEPVTSLALFPTLTPFPPTATLTPSHTPVPTETPVATTAPTATPTRQPTATAPPPRQHPVAAGETLYGLSLFYNVTMDVIAEQNGFRVDSPLVAGQVLDVPWPTPTPPLEAIVLDINGETVIADPTDCERAEIQAGDSAYAIAARYNVDFDILTQVNRLTGQYVLQPGDTLCIPQIIYGGSLPPTPGPSPTPAPTAFPAGPHLLYPPPNTIIPATDEQIVLQWVAVKDLAPDEWYMVEVTDVTDVGLPPRSGFTRQNNFIVPGEWRPAIEEEREMRWRVSIVRVTGQRQDGGFVYTYGGRSSDDGRFIWYGAVPTPTPTPTATPTSTPAP